METYGTIRILLRLAELCSPAENERKIAYMNRIDEIMKSLSEASKTTNDLSVLFDYEAPSENWSWKLASKVCDEAKKYGVFYSYSVTGRLLSNIASTVPEVRKKRSCIGTEYFLPPFREKQ